MTDLSTHEKKIAAANLLLQICTICFSEKVLSVCNDKDDEIPNILEKYSNSCYVCKCFKLTLPKPAVGNLFDPDKMEI